MKLFTLYFFFLPMIYLGVLSQIYAQESEDSFWDEMPSSSSLSQTSSESQALTPEASESSQKGEVPQKTEGHLEEKRTEEKQIKEKRGVNAQIAMIKNNGSVVYQVNNFDSPVIAYLSAGKKFKISLKKYPGPGGLGLFYKIKLRSHLVGYIADTDVIPRFEKKYGQRHIEENPIYNQAEEYSNTKEPIIEISQGRYIGAEISQVNLEENFRGSKWSSSNLFLGVRWTGPGALSETLPLDSEFLILPSPAKHYDSHLTATSGFHLQANTGLMFPISEKLEKFFYYTLGFVAAYTKISFLNSGVSDSYTSTRWGVYGGLSLALRSQKTKAFRFDAKYTIEKSSYTSVGLSYQVSY